MSNGPNHPRKTQSLFAAMERHALLDMARTALIAMRIKLGLPLADRIEAEKIGAGDDNFEGKAAKTSAKPTTSSVF